MSWRKKLLKESRLYVILDRKITRGRPLKKTAKELISSQAKIIQLRDKESDKTTVLKEALLLRGFFSDNRLLFIINDYPDIAKIAGADGVHLGQGDLSVAAARRLLGKEKIIGVSCHNLAQAQKAKREGADYIGMGPVFSTETKRIKRKKIPLSLINTVNKKIKLPVFAIGGITPENFSVLKRAGINRVASASAIFRGKNISAAVKNFL